MVSEGEAVALDRATGPVRAATSRRAAGWGLRENELRAILLVGDAAAVAAASFAAPSVWGAFDASYVPQSGLLGWQAASIVLWTAVIRLLGGGDVAAPHFARRSMTVVGQSLLGVAVIALALFFVQPFFAPRGATLTTLPLAAAAVLAWRSGYVRILRFRVFDRRVAVVGTDAVAQQVARIIQRAGGVPYRLVAFLAAAPGAHSEILGVPVIGAEEDVWSHVERLGIDQLVIGDIHDLPAPVADELVRCFEHGVEAQPATSVYEDLTGRVLASSLDAAWYGHLPTHTHGLYMPLKRAIDVLLALALVVATLPVILGAMLAMLLESGKPLLLRQERVGQRGRRFTLHKLRTMRKDAEAVGVARWADSGDARAGRIGRFLRRSHIDELPQIWNVLRGEMSLVGPRPERPQFVERLAQELPLYRARLLVPPGITGWAQVQHGYAASIQSSLEKLEYDLYYLRHFGPVLDLSIALRTLAVVIGLRGR